MSSTASSRSLGAGFCLRSRSGITTSLAATTR